MSLGLDLSDVVMSNVSDNSSLRNNIKNLLHEACVECSIIAQKCNQRKVIVEGFIIEVENNSEDQRFNDLGWSDDESVDETVDNAPAPTAEEIENKLKALLEKKFKQSFNN